MIDALTRALLLKYDPDNKLLQEAPQASVEAAITKAAHDLPLNTRIAIAKLQGLPELVVVALEKQLKTHKAKETE